MLLSHEVLDQLLSLFPQAVNFTDVFGRTPLYYAPSQQLADLLLEAGAKPHVKDSLGVSVEQFNNNIKMKRSSFGWLFDKK